MPSEQVKVTPDELRVMLAELAELRKLRKLAYCEDCGQSYAVHNDDGSCVDDTQ